MTDTTAYLTNIQFFKAREVIAAKDGLKDFSIGSITDYLVKWCEETMSDKPIYTYDVNKVCFHFSKHESATMFKLTWA